MSRITEFRVGFCRTVNLGNYESAKIEAAVTVQIDDLDDLAEVRAEAQLELRALLEETWKAQHKAKAKEDTG
jgi:hypothetical protein